MPSPRPCLAPLPAALLTAGGLLAAASAQAQACPSLPIAVQVRCQAVLLGHDGITKKLEAWTPKARLSLEAAGKQATVSFGDYTLIAGLTCSSGGPLQPDIKMAYQLEVRLTQKGRPYASPLHLAMLRNLDLEERSGRKPLTLASYYFLTPSVTIADVPFTRVDYLCAVETSS